VPPNCPDLGPGVTLLIHGSPRSAAVHDLLAPAVAATDGPCLWIDARNAAVTDALHERTARGGLRHLRVARAFTAYQHLTLVRRLPGLAGPDTGLVAAPNVASLYRDDDLPAWEADRLFAAALTVLGELAGALDCPVVLTESRADRERGDGALADRLVDAADREVDCRETPLGTRFEAEDFDTPGYWAADWWQTTVPYWADVCGVTDDIRASLDDPADVAAGADEAALAAALAGPGVVG
jgi:hypothetical protein